MDFHPLNGIIYLDEWIELWPHVVTTSPNGRKFTARFVGPGSQIHSQFHPSTLCMTGSPWLSQWRTYWKTAPLWNEKKRHPWSRSSWYERAATAKQFQCATDIERRRNWGWPRQSNYTVDYTPLLFRYEFGGQNVNVGRHQKLDTDDGWR